VTVSRVLCWSVNDSAVVNKLYYGFEFKDKLLTLTSVCSISGTAPNGVGCVLPDLAPLACCQADLISVRDLVCTASVSVSDCFCC
jgi:hypothetical protein